VSFNSFQGRLQLAEAIGIIGAGLAGSIAARRLADHGHRVLIFEKSGGVGGRLSTRRGDGGQFDHGAQYVTARGDAFQSVLADLACAGAVDCWSPDKAGHSTPWHIGTPGMSDLVKPLLAGIDIKRRCRIVAATRQRRKISLTLDDGTHDAFDRVIVTAPSPQALDLVGELDPCFSQLKHVVYAPCWAMMARFEGRDHTIAAFYRNKDDDAPVTWFAREDMKRPDDGDAMRLTVHAGGAWSRAHFDDEKAAVADQMYRFLQDRLGFGAPASFCSMHRWRYARVDTALQQAYLRGCDDRVIVAGDGLMGGRAEAAFDSGHQAAGFLLSL